MILLNDNINDFVSLATRQVSLREDDAVASKHVGVVMINKILFIYIYICCSVVGLGNKQYKMQVTYTKMAPVYRKSEKFTEELRNRSH